MIIEFYELGFFRKFITLHTKLILSQGHNVSKITIEIFSDKTGIMVFSSKISIYTDFKLEKPFDNAYTCRPNRKRA